MFCHIPSWVQVPVLLYSHQWLMILAHQVPVSFSRQLHLFVTAAEKLLMTAHIVLIKVLKTKTPREKDNCLPAKESLKHSSLLPFIISPCTRRYCTSCLCFHSFNKGTFTLIWFTHWIKENYVKRERKRSCVNMLVQRNILPSLLPFYLPD